jgi:CBS domain containing-hemolysin-like protein
MEWILIGVGVLLTLGTAVFVAAEFAFVALDRNSVESAVAAGDHHSAGVLTALRRLSTMLSGSQVGITITTLLVGYLVEPSVSVLLRSPLAKVGVPDDAITPVAVAIALVLATAFSMVVGELIPKNLAIAEPLRTGRAVAAPMRVFTMIAGPLIRLLNGSANGLLRRIGIEPQEELSGARTPQELASLVRRSAEAGTLAVGTASIITRSLRLRDRTAADVMTPRRRASFVDKSDPVSSLIALAEQTGHSRFPVTDGDDADDVVGVAHLKKAIAIPFARRGDVPVGAITVKTMRVPETMPLESLLVDLRGQGLALAVVVDEYGGTAGVVTLEDVVEELIGEVTDEHDSTRGQARRLRDGSWTVPGLWRPDELRERTGVDVPDDPAYETVGGFVMAALGRMPALGDQVPVPAGTLRVLRMDGRRVDLIRFTPDAGAAATAAEAGASV